jgi:hypothetical protein
MPSSGLRLGRHSNLIRSRTRGEEDVAVCRSRERRKDSLESAGRPIPRTSFSTTAPDSVFGVAPASALAEDNDTIFRRAKAIMDLRLAAHRRELGRRPLRHGVDLDPHGWTPAAATNIGRPVESFMQVFPGSRLGSVCRRPRRQKQPIAALAKTRERG